MGHISCLKAGVRNSCWLCPKRDLLAWFDRHWLITAGQIVEQQWAGRPATPATSGFLRINIDLQPLQNNNTLWSVWPVMWCRNASSLSSWKTWIVTAGLTRRWVQGAARADALSSILLFSSLFSRTQGMICPKSLRGVAYVGLQTRVN